MFETKIAISLNRYEELIKTEEKYNYLYSIIFNHYKDLLKPVFDYLDDIDWKKFKELQQEKQNKEG